MDAILHMPGPEFLALYGAILFGGLLVSWILVRSSSQGGLDPHVPHDPDPYELAYVQSGENGLSELALLELIQTGRLVADSTAVNERRPKLKPSQGTFRSSLPGPIERMAALFAGGREVKNVARSKEYRAEVEALAQPFRQRLDGGGLIAAKSAKKGAGWIGLAVLALGVAKLVTALMNGHYNVIFLILMLVAGLIAFLVIARLRLTWKGLGYLKKLRQAYSGDALAYPDAESAADPASRRALLTVAALYGAAFLMQTPGAAYAEMIGANRPNYHSGGGCGSSCSSSSGCGGGGCGGGCGGCGGD